MKRLNANLRRALIVAALAIFVWTATSEQARACGTPQKTPWVLIKKHSSTSYWIIILEYTTFGAGPNQFCACALQRVGPITAINQLRFVDSSTEEVLEQFEFAPDSTVGEQFASLAGGGTWQGFFASVGGTVTPGQSLELHFDVDVVPGTTFDELKIALESVGTVVGTDEAASDGTLFQGAHFSLVGVGAVLGLSAVPALGKIAIPALVLLLAAGLYLAVTRRRRRA